MVRENSCLQSYYNVENICSRNKINTKRKQKMKNLVNFAMTFGVNVVVMEGVGFQVKVINKKIEIDNPKAFNTAIKKDLQDPEARPYAQEILEIIDQYT